MTNLPLNGLRVLDLTLARAGPTCVRHLADWGADVIRIEPPGNADGFGGARDGFDSVNLHRNKRGLALDLKHPEGHAAFLRLADTADIVVENMRVAVKHRLKVDYATLSARNPRLVFERMTGWGQEGPYAQMAGHDINYISLAGALEPIGRAGEKPLPPLNLVGDFGGGGMFLAFGVVCALLEAKSSGQGQVVDAAMVDGSATLMTMFHAFRAMGIWEDKRGSNLLDTGADALAQILTWKDAEELFALAHFIGVTRPGHHLTDDGLPADRVSLLEVPAMAISSTDCRARVVEGRPVWYLVPDGVVQYISKRHLYRDARP